ncbi:MAG: RsmE family RNA methyltransferase [Bacteroidota bacterium]
MTPFLFRHIDEDFAVLEGEEARHALKVMRSKRGDRLVGIDGKGGMYLGKITEITKREVTLRILERHPNWGEKPQQITLMISPLHKNDRFEWLIEKAVELGVTRIQPYLSKHTVKTGLRPDRLERIMVAAIKQCLRSRLPELCEIAPLIDLLTRVPDEMRLIAHGPTGKPMTTFGPKLSNINAVHLLIGPEGDFAEEELRAAQDAGFETVALGHNRLRSETAAIHLLGLVKHYMGY